MKHKVKVIFSLFIIVCFSGCTYSRYGYSTKERPTDQKTWELEFVFWPLRLSSYKYIPPDVKNPQMAFNYQVTLVEIDTLNNPRLDFMIDNTQLRFNTSNMVVPLSVKEKNTLAGQYVGATCVYHTYTYGLIDVPKPRPDSVYVDQDITIYNRDNRNILKTFHYQAKGVLYRIRRWHIIDILEGS